MTLDDVYGKRLGKNIKPMPVFNDAGTKHFAAIQLARDIGVCCSNGDAGVLCQRGRSGRTVPCAQIKAAKSWHSLVH
jgi:hypothetical protein